MSLSDVMTIPNVLSREQCVQVHAVAAEYPAVQETQYGQETRVTACAVRWLPLAAMPRGIVDQLESAFNRANDHFGFDIQGIAEHLKVLDYDVGQEIPWHMDCGPLRSATRKLSMSIPLVRAGEYEGGSLEFADVQPLEADLGDALVFPSFRSHRVTSVRKGRRAVLVAWAHGPTFR